MGRTKNARTVDQLPAARKAASHAQVAAHSPATHATDTTHAALALPVSLCAACGFDHPKPKGVALPSGVSPFLTPAELATFIGKQLSTVYSEKSRGRLPPPLARPGNPRWDPCRIATWLHRAPVTTPARHEEGAQHE